MFKVGQTVEWTSQSGGFTKTKEGEVWAVIPTGVDPIRMDGIAELLKATPKSRIKFDDGARDVDRVLVQVPRGGKSLLCDYYCPYADKVTIKEVE